MGWSLFGRGKAEARAVEEEFSQALGGLKAVGIDALRARLRAIQQEVHVRESVLPSLPPEAIVAVDPADPRLASPPSAPRIPMPPVDPPSPDPSLLPSPSTDPASAPASSRPLSPEKSPPVPLAGTPRHPRPATEQASIASPTTSWSRTRSGWSRRSIGSWSPSTRSSA